MTALPGRLVLLGHPVRHSLSPRIQNAALARAGIPLTYEALDVPPASLDAVLATLRRERAAGNVTVPLKAAVADRCRLVTEMVSVTGAVNTFFHQDDALVGDNTDVAGFHAMAVSILGPEPRGLQVALIGAGGAASAVCAAVASWEGSRVALWGRSTDRASALAARYRGLVDRRDTMADAIANADVIVNATPIGLHGDGQPVPVERMPRDAAVMDLAYRAGETPWVRAARAAGHRAADGREMLIEQGALAFERWFGIVPDRDVMRAALDG